MVLSVLDLRLAKDIQHTKRLCNYINLPSPTSKWVEYQSILSVAYKERAKMSMAWLFSTIQHSVQQSYRMKTFDAIC